MTYPKPSSTKYQGKWMRSKFFESRYILVKFLRQKKSEVYFDLITFTPNDTYGEPLHVSRTTYGLVFNEENNTFYEPTEKDMRSVIMGAFWRRFLEV
jgi:hypothetical protein